MKEFLTQKKAELRAQSIQSNVTYKLFLDLEKGKAFSGMGHYTFNLNKTENVFLSLILVFVLFHHLMKRTK